MKFVMQHRVGFPPNYRKIVQVFPKIRGMAVFIAYGDTIYNPRGAVLTPAKVAHETLHGERQLAAGGPETWWDRYLEDKAFRQEEEMLAYRAELAKLRSQTTPDRERIYLEQVARDFSNPMYEGLISYQNALKVLAA